MTYCLSCKFYFYINNTVYFLTSKGGFHNRRMLLLKKGLQCRTVPQVQMAFITVQLLSASNGAFHKRVKFV
jgi:hypothetical protein